MFDRMHMRYIIYCAINNITALIIQQCTCRNYFVTFNFRVFRNYENISTTKISGFIVHYVQDKSLLHVCWRTALITVPWTAYTYYEWSPGEGLRMDIDFLAGSHFLVLNKHRYCIHSSRKPGFHMWM